MNELEIDQTYLDDYFVNIVNSLNLEKFIEIFNLVIENFQNDFSHEKISNLSKIISALISDVDAAKFLRQLKYLINKGTYNRLSKKYKNDLIQIGIAVDIIDAIVEIQKGAQEKIAQYNKIDELNSLRCFPIKDFEVKTEMPIYTTNYNIITENGLNEDLKKQNIILNLNLDGSNNLVLQMDKAQLINFYEEIEKIQEKLDKLY